jgi:hypothetical protein
MQPCVILKRLPMPDRMAWKFTLRSETPEKHAFALGQTTIAPPIPALRSTAALDAIAMPNDPAVDDVVATVAEQAETIEQQAAKIATQDETLTNLDQRLRALEPNP